MWNDSVLYKCSVIVATHLTIIIIIWIHKSKNSPGCTITEVIVKKVHEAQKKGAITLHLDLFNSKAKMWKGKQD